jgi:hypothetical protein
VESSLKALMFLGAGKNKLEWQERPDLTVQGDLEAIVRPIASVTCDLDREILRGTVPMSQHPGFEPVGVRPTIVNPAASPARPILPASD